MASEDSTKGLIKTREQTHGPFEKQAACSQVLKDHLYMHLGPSDPVVTEALEMILHKISRIAVGNYYVDDHWDDIAGYAILAKNTLNKRKQND